MLVRMVRMGRATGKGGREVTDIERIDRIAENLSDEQVLELVNHRGGCRCCISPPCPAHCDPLTIPEAKHLGWWDEEGGAQ